MRRSAVAALLAVLLLWPVSPAGAQDAQSWEFRGGRWQQVEAPLEVRPGDPMLDHVEHMLERGQHRAARRRILRWLRDHRTHPERDRGLLLLAEAYYQYGDRIRAFYHLDELMDHYPESPLFHDALQMQYDVADAFLRGYRMRFFGIPMLTGTDEAIEMLFRIQQRSPGSPLAERALLRTADFYYQDQQFDLAADAYAAYVRSYPRSPLVPEARLKQAFANWAQFRGVRYDATPLLNARAQLVALTMDYPDLAAEENIPLLIARIDETFARRIYLTADFYRRTREPVAAAYNYHYLMEQYPNSVYARQAEENLRRLPRWARERFADRDAAEGEADEPAASPDPGVEIR